MARPITDIIEQYQQRKRNQYPVINQMQRIRDQYNGDIAIPVLDKTTDPAIINILLQGVDQHAMRLTSTQPDVYFMPQRTGVDTAIKMAELQRQVALGTWKKNQIVKQDHRRGRQYVAYGLSPVVIRPDMQKRRARWELRDPLGTYPAPTHDMDEITPPDCIFTYTRTFNWIKKWYPAAAQSAFFNRNDQSGEAQGEARYTIIEYVDDLEIVLGVINESASTRDNTAYTSSMSSYPKNGAGMELSRIPNRANMPTAVMWRRVSLERMHGQFDGLLGMYMRQAELMELSYDIAKRGARPEQWIVARAGEVPKMIVDADPDEGIVGQVSGGDLRDNVPQPAYDVAPMIDRLERYQRSDSSTPTEFGSEQGSASVRTSLRGNAVMNAGISFPIQEGQQMFELAKEEELRVMMAVDKGYFGSEKKSVFFSYKGNKSRLEYTPKELWKSADELYVKFSHAGADINMDTAILGQLLGMELLSHETAGRQHPYIEDWDMEKDRIISESIEGALLNSVDQQVAAGQMEGIDVADLLIMIRQNKDDLPQAYKKIHEAAQKRQAELAQAQQGSPEAQPGLSQAIPAGPPGQPPVQELPQGLTNVMSNIGKFALTQRGANTINAGPK